MLILIHVAHLVKTFPELFASAAKPTREKDDKVVRADTKDFGFITRVYGVAIGKASVAGKYSEVTASDACD